MKEAFAEMNADWKKGEDEMKAKMDSIIELQHMRLDLERERLQFEREKFGLPSRYLYYLGKCTNHILQHVPLCISATTSSAPSNYR